MSLKKLRTVVLATAVVLFVGVAGAWGYCRWSIQTGLDRCCELAQSEYSHPGDDVAAMMDYVRSESHSLRERNLVVWALGQARDSRALPLLESYYTGEKCDHDRSLCQSELAKAIELCQGDAPNPLFIKTP